MIFVRNHFPIITCFSFSTNIDSLYVKDIEQLPSSGNFITGDILNVEFSVNDLSLKQAQRAENCVDVTEFKQLFQFLDSLLFLFKPNVHLARCSSYVVFAK